MDHLMWLLLTGVMQGGLYSLIALGFVLIWKASGVFNVAQGQLIILGAYLAYQFVVEFGLPWWISSVLTLGLMSVFAIAVERLVLRPMAGQPIMATIIGTLALSVFLDGVMAFFWPGSPRLFPDMFPIGGIPVLGVPISYSLFLSFLVAMLFLVVFALFFKYSDMALRMRAVCDDAIVAQSLGVRLKNVNRMVWIIASVVAVVAGILLTSVTGVHYAFVSMGLRAIAVVLLGGLESIFGVIIAGPIIGCFEILAAAYLDPVLGGGVREVVSFVLLIPILLAFPRGLFGWKEIERI